MNPTKALPYQPAPLTRRMLAFVIDALLVIVLLFIFYSLALVIAGNFVDLNGLLTQYYELGVEKGVFVTSIASSFDSINSTVVTSLVYSAISVESAINSAFVNDPEVIAVITQFNTAMTWIMIATAFFSTVVVYLVLPLVLSQGQTLGKRLFNLGLATNQGESITFRHLASRYFLGIFVVEVLFSLLLMSLTSLPIVIIISLFMVLFSNKNQAIHDLISQTVVIDLREPKEIVNSADLSREDQARANDEMVKRLK